MDTLNIEPTLDTPKVTLDKGNNLMEISGKSFPEDIQEFFSPILKWIDDYIENPNPNTNFVFKLIYFNSASYKPILNVLFKLERLVEKGADVKVTWYAKDGDREMKESGEQFAEMVTVPFEFHELVS